MAAVLAVLFGAPLAAAVLIGVLVLKIVLDARGKLKALADVPTFPEVGWLGHWPWWKQTDIWKKVQAKAKALGPVYRVRLGPVPMLVVSDPAEYTRACHRGDDYLEKATSAYECFNKVHFGPWCQNILSMDSGEQWKVLRRALSPCFSTSRMKPAFEVTAKITQSILDQVAADGPSKSFDVSDLARRVTVGVISQWGFLSPTSAADLSTTCAFVEQQQKTATAVHQLWMDPFWWLSLLTDKSARVHRENCRVFDNAMAEYTKSLQARFDELPPDTIGGALLRAINPKTGERLAFHELKSNVAIVHTAGFETTSSTFSSMMVLLLQHPSAMREVEKELDAAGLLKTATRPSPRPLEWSDIGKLTYIPAVIKEALRLMPPASLGTVRMTGKPTKICSYAVPAGVAVNFPHAVVDRSTAAYGTDAEEFVPERWMDKASKDAETVKEPFAFSVGPRDCVGQALARVELTAVLTMMIARFTPRLDTAINTFADLERGCQYRLTLAYVDGVFIKFEPR